MCVYRKACQVCSSAEFRVANTNLQSSGWSLLRGMIMFVSLHLFTNKKCRAQHATSLVDDSDLWKDIRL